MTPYHAKYWAYELTRRCPADSVDRLASALVDAQVDLNPHQVDAALFAFRSPLSKGALLADEVGLGKTIEAGLVIVSSNLRKQWHQELSEKFFLPCTILESKPYNDDIKRGQFRPFERDAIVICSYQFARNKASDVHSVPWDLVVDEAHRLRNVYKPGNIIANTLKQALAHAPKLLLTATPLQNSLLEVFNTLKARLKPVCQRTLRRQVTAYVSYTRRMPMVEHFSPDESEDRLYAAVSDYLRRDNLLALPSSQRSLMTLVLRKLLASSTFAIAGALNTLVTRLRAKIKRQEPVALEEALEQLQLELNFEITETLDLARQLLLENFDDEVREKHARFAGDAAFTLDACPFPGDIPLGLYELPRRSGEAHFYRLNHPLAQAIVSAAKGRTLDDGVAVDMAFDYSNYKGKISAIEPLLGKSGLLRATAVAIESLDQTEDHIVLVATTGDGPVDEEAARRLFSLSGTVGSQRLSFGSPDTDQQIKEARKGAVAAVSLEAKLAAQKRMKSLESERNSRRRTLFEAQDEIDRKRGELIAQIESKLTQKVQAECLFTIRWSVV